MLQNPLPTSARYKEKRDLDNQHYSGAKEKAEQVKAFAAKPEDLSSISETHMVEGEPIPAKLSSASHQHHAAHMYTKNKHKSKVNITGPLHDNTVAVKELSLSISPHSTPPLD